jgi:ribosomal protein L40E
MSLARNHIKKGLIIILLTIILIYQHLSPVFCFEDNTNRQGGPNHPDYRHFNPSSSDPQLCYAACLNEQQEGCQAFTYTKPGVLGPQAVCWLKKTVPPPNTDPYSISGVVKPRISIGGGPVTTHPNNPVDIYVTVFSRNLEPIKGAEVKLSSNEANFDQSPKLTEEDGSAHFQFIPTHTGRYEFKAIVDDSTDFTEGSSTLVVDVSPPPIQWEIILIPIIVIVAIIILWSRRNLQVLPKGNTLPCDGKSTMPIKVQFTNAFGKLKKQGSDCEVKMTTTSGQIDNIIVPAGKTSAEAVLTSSNDSGPVTVTARSGGRTASAQLQFVANEIALDLETDKPEIPADNKSQAVVTVMVRSAEGAHITFPDDRTIELSTTHGKITSPIKISSRSLSGTAILTAGDQSGTATVTATSGSLKGEVEIVFAELEKRFCMWCGASMKLEAERCAKCSKTPPSHIDTKQCPTCDMVLPKNAGYCEKCGAMQSDGTQAKSNDIG